MHPDTIHIPGPRMPDYEALHLDLVSRLVEWRDEVGASTYLGQRIDAALRGEDE